ncbi:MAG TPA: DUF3108 domain-containing protein [Marinagarivorans sp.]
MILRFTQCLMASLLLSALSTQISLAQPLFEAVYEGEYSNFNITMTRTLNGEKGQYTLDSKAKSFMAKIDERSEFNLEGDHLRPKSYGYERKIFGVKKREDLAFDWKARTATYTKNGDREGQQRLKAGMLDPTLYQLQLQRDLAANPKQKDFNYTFIRRNQTKTYDFKRTDDGTIALGDKQYSAIVVVRADDSKKETRLWLIPELDYVLAKIRHTDEDGDTYEVLLKRYSGSKAFSQFLTDS